MNRNSLFRVIDSGGDVWGLIAAATPAEAVAIVAADHAANPDDYLGTPRGLRAREV